MKKRRTLRSKIMLRTSLKKEVVFLRNDFDEFGGYDQVGRALNQLVREKKLIKIGYGLYAKAKKSKLTGELVPQSTLPELARDALSKLGVKTYSSTSDDAYNSGKSTQIPTGRTIAVKGRIVRNIGYNGIFINYERKTK